MKKRLANVNPLQCGIVLAALQFCLSLLIVPVFLLGAIVAANSPQLSQRSGGNPFGALGFVFVILIPVFYTVVGFIGGVIAALVYNLIAKMTGGLEFTTVDMALNVPPTINYASH